MSYIVGISEKVLSSINELSENEVELCGMLLGYELKNTQEFRIESNTLPTIYDESSETSCKRDLSSHSDYFNNLQLKDRDLRYLGEFHTHPRWYGSNPSTYDDNERKRYTKKYSKRGRKMFFITKAPGHELVIFMCWIEGKVLKTFNQSRGIKDEDNWLFNTHK